MMAALSEVAPLMKRKNMMQMQPRRPARNSIGSRPAEGGSRVQAMESRPVAASTDGVRIAVLLGLDKVVWETVALADAVARGLPCASASHLRQALGDAAFFNAFPAAAGRSRRPHGRLCREESQKFYGVAKILAAAARLYGDDLATAALFVAAPHAMLRGRSPLELSVSGSAGADAAMSLLLAAEASFAA